MENVTKIFLNLFYFFICFYVLTCLTLDWCFLFVLLFEFFINFFFYFLDLCFTFFKLSTLIIFIFLLICLYFEFFEFIINILTLTKGGGSDVCIIGYLGGSHEHTLPTFGPSLITLKGQWSDPMQFMAEKTTQQMKRVLPTQLGAQLIVGSCISINNNLGFCLSVCTQFC